MRRALSALAVVAAVAGAGLLTGASDPDRTLKTYEIDIANASAAFIINVFFWPGVSRG